MVTSLSTPNYVNYRGIICLVRKFLAGDGFRVGCYLWQLLKSTALDTPMI
ncbi:hypothetical protein AmaxDRAFT_1129 [Limnospira maxima CS-328]|uniref:Uncharacterized protein n=1 Tax=Limnospira maxima CS-328 TaxID=513049 RepID=B5VX87_LIMMA|nr:hypothetical protein AmaxDRAFT_1129 [Limnospira maxima CS-328]